DGVVELDRLGLDRELPASVADAGQARPSHAVRGTEALEVARRVAVTVGRESCCQRPAIGSGPGYGAGGGEEGRRDVHRAGERVRPPSCWEAGPSDHERDVQRRIVREDAVAHLVVLAEALAVVADHDDEPLAPRPRT